jgi:dolichyl-phosphate beta-glucosyltransferase
VAGAPDLSVVIPAYNEERRLPETLHKIEPYLAKRSNNFELILVDDGSADGTLRLMREESDRRPYVKVVALPKNRGKGRALATGVTASSGRLVLISDADLSTPIEELPKLEAALANGADVAIASRAKRGARIEISQPPHRVLMGKVFNLIVQSLLLPGIWDTQCGFKLFKGDLGRHLFEELKTDGFGYDVEVLYRARRGQHAIAEVPVRWQHSAPTRVAAFRSSLDMLKDVIMIRLGR